METDSGEEELETRKLSRMKELEAMVKKLTQENEQLLTQVKGEAIPTNANEGETINGGSDENDIINFSDTEIGDEDVW